MSFFYNSEGITRIIIVSLLATLTVLLSCESIPVKIDGVQQSESFTNKRIKKDRIAIGRFISNTTHISDKKNIAFSRILKEVINEEKPEYPVIPLKKVLQQIGQEEYSKLRDELSNGAISPEIVSRIITGKNIRFIIFVSLLENRTYENNHDEEELDDECVRNEEEKRGRKRSKQDIRSQLQSSFYQYDEYEAREIKEKCTEYWLIIETVRQMNLQLTVYDLELQTIAWRGYLSGADSNSFGIGKERSDSIGDALISSIVDGVIEGVTQPDPPKTEKLAKSLLTSFVKSFP